MLDTDRINEIHRLHHGEPWSLRKIARQLHLARKTLRKYLDSPVQAPARRTRTRKIDRFRSVVGSLLEQDPSASAVVILWGSVNDENETLSISRLETTLAENPRHIRRRDFCFMTGGPVPPIDDQSCAATLR
jgi:hypothetical protein